jgi:zinc D-Ala-D-Ala dipeptidase
MTPEPNKLWRGQRTVACEDLASQGEFVRLSTIADTQVDLRYATNDNFMGFNLYAGLDCAWIHRDAAHALARVTTSLKAHHPDLRIKILDAVRPQRVQETLWARLRGTPLVQYLAEPGRGSIHSFGMAVDVTLIDASDKELDMGTLFDDLTERSHPALEAKFRAQGVLSARQLSNRQILREAMRHGGFQGINTEWWHFDCGDRLQVRARYQRVL